MSPAEEPLESLRALGAGKLAVGVAALAIGLALGRLTGGGAEADDFVSGAPSQGHQGVALGYSRDEAGAAAAAANLSAALAHSIAEGPERVLRVAELVSTDGYESRVRAVYADRQVLDPSATVLFRAVPIAYEVLAFSADAAEVRVWSASILAGDDETPGAASFKTTSIIVRWQGGDWKLDDVRDPVPGPTPSVSSPDPGSDFVRSLRSMEPFLALP